ncbi:cell division protein [Halalkalibacillus sediminis]|uniref:Cell division protein n=1 Tax=Halalkalibacillus sediminis TaxID=2018042 RepID=A0A2I0QYA2_9BACI|nr:cell division protein FtsA [Halalkalibacillus sediminis]PKR79311.1 cell division protein [Halalkalibacillus sediminis]
MSDKLFALDIGTRSVVGIILKKIDQSYEVIEMISKEHEERSMLDGQIHNVLAVSKVIQQIKNQLEEKHGPLKKVCVAAAGRALKTKESSVEIDISQQPLMTEDDIFHLELAAVQQAQYQLAEEEKDHLSSNYYCVGYSVLHYYLDDEDIGSLLDQQGEKAKVDVIATFLPKVVVESLLSALQRAELEMDALTLEPIAAIQVLIPQSMRRLNVALVDIGAGTSDIAITNDGTVTAYGMVPKAGDEITEALSDQYLLDFNQAEKAKRDLTSHASMEIEDILGFKTTVDQKEVVKTIEYAIDELSASICDQILKLNQKAPKAVMLVGGGSLTPSITQKIAKHLQLPDQRVAVRGIDAIQLLANKENLPVSPEFVTPIGIAIAAKQSPVHYISVQVNNRTVRLFDLKQLTIGDSLLAAGIELNKLYGKPGIAIFTSLNGKKITLPGTFGEAPSIFINGEEASLQDRIQHGDEIFVEQGKDGSTPTYRVKDVIGDLPTQTITLQNQPVELRPNVIVNGKHADMNQVLKDGDQINWSSTQNVEDIFKQQRLNDLIDLDKPFHIYLNGKRHQTKEKIIELLVNGQPASFDQSVRNGDQIAYSTHNQVSVNEFLNELNLSLAKKITVFYEGNAITLTKDYLHLSKNGQILKGESLLYPGDQLELEKQMPSPFIFQDLFRYIDLEPEYKKGYRFKLFKNGHEVGFSEEIADNDELSISWTESIYSNE